MSSQAVPKLIQRFRARELQRLVDKSGLRDPSHRGRSVLNLKGVRTDKPLYNPFLPRPLFKRDVNADTSSSTNPISDANNAVNPKSAGKTGQIDKKNWKERKKWAEARYSLRRQAVLVKLARASGTLHLLPPGPKLSVEELEAAKRAAKEREEAANANGTLSGSQEAPTPTSSVRLRRQRRRRAAVLGYPGVVFRWMGKAPEKARKRLTIYTGRRRMFKGHKWERHLDKRRGKTAVRVRDMPKRIARFKNVYRRRRPNPLKPAAPRKKESLPF